MHNLQYGTVQLLHCGQSCSRKRIFFLNGLPLKWYELVAGSILASETTSGIAQVPCLFPYFSESGTAQYQRPLDYYPFVWRSHLSDTKKEPGSKCNWETATVLRQYGFITLY